jgi:hypothetical protein
MTDIVDRLRAERPQFSESTMKEAADEIERLTLERETWTAAYKAACAIGDARGATIDRLRALLKRHDDCWRLLHNREYIGPLRGATRAALGEEQTK